MLRDAGGQAAGRRRDPLPSRDNARAALCAREEGRQEEEKHAEERVTAALR